MRCDSKLQAMYLIRMTVLIGVAGAGKAGKTLDNHKSSPKHPTHIDHPVDMDEVHDYDAVAVRVD